MTAKAESTVSVASLLLCLSLSSVAHGKDAAEAARQHNAAAKNYFHLGKFAEAAREYERAYEVKPVPAFLYNLGQCYKRMAALEHLEKAKFYLESYLHNAPDAPNAAHVKQEIAELDDEIAKLQKATPVSPVPAVPTLERSDKDQTQAEPRAEQLVVVSKAPGATPAPRPTPFYKRWWFWTAIGAVVAVTATTVALAVQPGEAPTVTGTMPPGRIELE